MAEKTFLQKFDDETAALDQSDTGQALRDIVRILAGLGVEKKLARKTILALVKRLHLPLRP